MKFLPIIIFLILLSTQTTIFAVDESDVSIQGLKKTYKVGEIMDFTVNYPSFCGSNLFAVEDIKTDSIIWERTINIGCQQENEFLDRQESKHITTESPKPGGATTHADPVITSYEGEFRLIYESQQIKKIWTYRVFEKIPLHLDTDAHIRLVFLAIFYIVLPLYVYKEELSKFRK